MKKEKGQPRNDLYSVYGIQALLEAFQSGKEVSKVFIQKEIRNDGIDAVIQKCKEHHVPFQFVPRESKMLPKNRNHQGVAATISPVSFYQLEEIITGTFERGEIPLIVVLDHITDVRNFGAIARSAYCAGAHCIVVPDQGSAPVNEDAVKTSAGALFSIPVCRERNLKSVMELLNQSGIKTIGCTEKANKQLPFVSLTEPTALVMGSEEKGISNEVIKKCAVLARIPLEKGVSSLNVSVAAGIALYEAVRQRMTGSSAQQ